MANAAYLVSTLVMGLLGVGVVVMVLRGRRWHNYTPTVAYGMNAGAGRPRSGFSRIVGSPNTWTLVYLLAVFGFLAGVLVTISGAVGGTGVIVGLVAALVVYIVGGVYIALRGHGRPKSIAVFGSATVLGLLILVGISAKLILGL